MKNIFIFISLFFFFSSCASIYKPLRQDLLDQSYLYEKESIKYSYQYQSLELAGNKKYAKKENRKNIKLVFLKIENNTDRTLRFNQDIKLIKGGYSVIPMPIETIHKTLKQQGAYYLLWSFLYFIQKDCTNDDCQTKIYPVGAGIGLFNIAIAAGANKQFKDELTKYDLSNKDIAPGETVYGLVGIHSRDISSIELKLN